MKPEISVIVPHYDDLRRLDICLTALCQQSLESSRFEIVVADNMSPVGIAEVAAVAAGRASVVSAPEKGAGPARNAGVAASQAPLLAFTDSDCVPKSDWLEAGLASLKTAEVVGGAMKVSVASPKAMTGAEAFETVFAFDNRRYVEKKGFSVTANLFCRRAVFDAVGPFRAGVSEDVDWCQRAARAGFPIVYASDAVVTHPARRDWAELKRKWQRMNSEGFSLVGNSASARGRWVARALVVPFSILPHAPRVLKSPALPDTRSRLLGLATLVRLRLWRSADALTLALRRR